MAHQISYKDLKGPTDDDCGSLKQIATFHLIVGGLGITGAIMLLLINWGDLEFRYLIGALFGSFLVFFASGLCMWLHRYRIFSLIVASITCLAFPIGTILGIFTIVILSKAGIAQIYRS
jgi:hypothetical protein